MSLPLGVQVTISTQSKASHTLLSVQAAPGKAIDCFTTDDGSGRQRWVLEPAGDGLVLIRTAEPARDGSIVAAGAAGVELASGATQKWAFRRQGAGWSIEAAGAGEFRFLSAHADGWDNNVDLWKEVGPEGRQTWQVRAVPAVRTQVPPEAAARLRGMLGIDEAQVDTIQSLVACPENSTTNWPRAYGFAKFLGDGRGITFGIVGFCSGTGDGVLVLEATVRRAPSHRLGRYVAAMRRTRGDDRSGLDGFEAAVRASEGDQAFREAQWEVAGRLYWNFSRDFCLKQGGCEGRPGPPLRSALAIGAMYDTALNHGGGMSSFRPILSRMGSPAAGDEGQWIKNFMEARFQLLRSGYQSLDTSGTGARARIWQKLVDERNWDLRRPIDVYSGAGAYWGRQRVA